MTLGVPLGLVAGGIVSDYFGNAATFESALVGVLAAAVVAWWLVPDLRVPVPPGLQWSKLFKAMTDRRLFAIGTLTFAVAFSAQGMVLTTLSLLVHARGWSLLGYGDKGTSSLLMGLLVAVAAVAMPLAGRLGDRLHAHATIALLGTLALVPSLLLIALSPTTTGLALGIALMGLATGVLSPSLLALVSDLVPPEQRGLAVGVLQLWGDIGGTLGPLVGTTLFAGSLRTPYLASALLICCFVPLAARLVPSPTKAS
jgi:MFS family permease